MADMPQAFSRRQLLTGLAASAAALLTPVGRALAQTRGQAPRPVASSAKPHLTVYKDPNCGCCGEWVKYMQAKGYRATVMNLGPDKLGPLKQQYHIGPNLQSCHTTLVDGFVVEGHVPEGDIVRLLKERPKDVVGLTVPGMPASAPGMDVTPFQPYTVLTFNKAGQTTVWARHTKPA